MFCWVPGIIILMSVIHDMQHLCIVFVSHNIICLVSMTHNIICLVSMTHNIICLVSMAHNIMVSFPWYTLIVWYQGHPNQNVELCLRTRCVSAPKCQLLMHTVHASVASCWLIRHLKTTLALTWILWVASKQLRLLHGGVGDSTIVVNSLSPQMSELVEDAIASWCGDIVGHFWLVRNGVEKLVELRQRSERT